MKRARVYEEWGTHLAALVHTTCQRHAESATAQILSKVPGKIAVSQTDNVA